MVTGYYDANLILEDKMQTPSINPKVAELEEIIWSNLQQQDFASAEENVTQSHWAGADDCVQPALRCDFLHLFNAMIEKQKKEPGDAIVSTVLFDNYREVIHDRVDWNNTGRQVCLYNLEEGNRGATRLPVFYNTHTLMENRRLLTCLV